MFEFNRNLISYCCQCSIDGIEKCFLTYIVLRTEPFTLKNLPKRFCNIR